MTLQQSLPFLIDGFTFAEAAQMYCERERAEWQHTAEILSVLTAANWDQKKQGKPPTAAMLNPWEANQHTKRNSLPLNSREGFDALKQVAQQWPGRK